MFYVKSRKLWSPVRTGRRNVHFHVAGKVLLQTHTLSSSHKSYTDKFATKRDGSYLISKVITPNSYTISTLGPNLDVGKYHVFDIFQYVEPCKSDEESVVLNITGDPEREKCGTIPFKNVFGNANAAINLLQLYLTLAVIINQHSCICRATFSWLITINPYLLLLVWNIGNTIDLFSL